MIRREVSGSFIQSIKESAREVHIYLFIYLTLVAALCTPMIRREVSGSFIQSIKDSTREVYNIYIDIYIYR